MTAREILAYAITHAPKGVKGGPYEAESGPPGEECDSLRDACRWPTTEADARECAVMYLEDHLSWCGDARVIRIVRARPSEASATLETARRRLAAVAESMTEHAYQEMASALEVDACRAGPSEASAVDHGACGRAGAVVTAREILAYAITHAPKGVKGGPYVADMGYMPTPDLAHAWRSGASELERARRESKKRRGTRVIRIVRARPFKETIPVCGTCGYDAHGGRDEESEPAPSPSEASAVEVLRELLRVGATLAGKTPLPKEDIRVSLECFADEVRDVRAALDRARRVLAASGPDPSEVVRDLVMLVAGELDYDLAKSLEPATAEESREAERTMRDAVKCVTERFVVERKAGGK
ncbi:MAG TPA: hypothetical protein PK141_00450 [Polyangiaceae bacterium]|nr:hypothetical protein [Polyangiaceae bacterium]